MLASLANDKVALVRTELAVSVAENYIPCEEVDKLVATLQSDPSPSVVNEINLRLPKYNKTKLKPKAETIR